ncbi:hypothetical protein [Streptomyces fulvorobeus]|nr:hypothetical protein [Streptomyces fulvorobeus]NYE40702.1 hypothetical protein [Streptomyces fulvorobeus]
MRTHTTAALIAAGLLATLTACSTSEHVEDKTVTAPPYKIAKQDSDGNTRDVVVEVDHTTDLRAVFDDVVHGLSDEAGYHVVINCSTGGTASADNRLANGQHAIGSMGAATTGLDEGASEFSINKGRTCPAA